MAYLNTTDNLYLDLEGAPGEPAKFVDSRKYINNQENLPLDSFSNYKEHSNSYYNSSEGNTYLDLEGIHGEPAEFEELRNYIDNQENLPLNYFSSCEPFSISTPDSVRTENTLELINSSSNFDNKSSSNNGSLNYKNYLRPNFVSSVNNYLTYPNTDLLDGSKNSNLGSLSLVGSECSTFESFISSSSHTGSVYSNYDTSSISSPKIDSTNKYELINTNYNSKESEVNKSISNSASHSMANSQDLSCNFASLSVSNNSDINLITSRSTQKKYSVPDRIRKKDFAQMSEEEKKERKKIQSKNRSKRHRENEKLKEALLQTTLEEEEKRNKELEDKHKSLVKQVKEKKTQLSSIYIIQ